VSADVDRLRAELESVRDEIRRASNRIRQLRDQERALEFALSQQVSGKPDLWFAAGREPGRGRKRITPLVRALLTTSPEPLDRHTLSRMLHEHGSPASPDTVSASLSYLRRKGVAVNVGGMWTARAAE
jgi:hypothetical protein